MIVMRIIAQIIDLLCAFILLLVCLIWAAPWLNTFFPNDMLLGIVIVFLFICVLFLLQLPFLMVNQSIGKAFCGLEIQSTNSERPLTLSILLQREIFCKLMTCYFLCLPVISGQLGGHEIATETCVRSKRRKG